MALRDPLELGSDGAQTVDRWLFGPDIAVGDVWVAGRRQVREGRHVARDRIADRFARTVRQVLHDG